MKIQKPTTPAGLLLVLLLATDVLLIVAHILWLTTPYIHHYTYSLVQERGLGEVFQYVKAFWLVVMFSWVAVITRQAGYLSWTVVFGYMGLDDIMQIHEEGGYSLAMRWELPEMLGQRPRDIGELIIFAVAGAIMLVLLAISWFISNETFRQRSITLFKLCGILIFFGIVMDAVHILFLDTALDDVFGTIEDGGELIALSLIVAFVFAFFMKDSLPEAQLVAAEAAHDRTTTRNGASRSAVSSGSRARHPVSGRR